jgi:hypothetical protein
VAIIDKLPWPQRPDQRTRARLITAARTCLERGHPARTIRQHAADGIPGADRPAGSVLTRLRDLVDTDPTPNGRPSRPPHCGTCHEPTRHRETPDGRPYPCPACHPDPDRRAAGAGIETRP